MGLSVKNLRKSYNGKVVVDDLSFEMPNPGVYALLGTNGAGKTTSIRMMLGMLAQDSGEVLWNGAPISSKNCNIGYLAEERGLYPKFTLMDQLVYFAELRGVSRSEARSRIKYWSSRLEVDEYLYPTKPVRAGGISLGKAKNTAPILKTLPSKKADQLSKGNQQKIQLIAALISDPELIVLDEPMSGLDPINTEIFKSIIREEINNGKYLIMSSHQMATVEEFCTDITILNRSKTVLQGNLNEIKKAYGRVNLRLKTEQDASKYITASGAKITEHKEFEYEIKVDGEDQANRILGSLISSGVTVITFDLREPSLHEIFVEKVGGANEEK